MQRQQGAGWKNAVDFTSRTREGARLSPGLCYLSPPPLCLPLFIHSLSWCQAAKEIKSHSGSSVICFVHVPSGLKKLPPVISRKWLLPGWALSITLQTLYTRAEYFAPQSGMTHSPPPLHNFPFVHTSMKGGDTHLLQYNGYLGRCIWGIPCPESWGKAEVEARFANKVLGIAVFAFSHCSGWRSHTTFTAHGQGRNGKKKTLQAPVTKTNWVNACSRQRWVWQE